MKSFLSIVSVMSLLKEIAKLLEPAPSLPDLEEINNEGDLSAGFFLFGIFRQPS